MKVYGSGFWRDPSKVSRIDQRSEQNGWMEKPDLQFIAVQRLDERVLLSAHWTTRLVAQFYLVSL